MYVKYAPAAGRCRENWATMIATHRTATEPIKNARGSAVPARDAPYAIFSAIVMAGPAPINPRKTIDTKPSDPWASRSSPPAPPPPGVTVDVMPHSSTTAAAAGEPDRPVASCT